ncbi:MAG: hypothetical protein AAGA18_07100 [Verrucomicrobiota bacterium]
MNSFLKLSLYLVHIVFLADFIASYAYGAPTKSKISLDDEDAMRIGKMIWKNECGGTISGLTMWNPGEEFPSLGIGHFIWYPVGYEGPFDESFPKLIAFMKEEGVEVPQWLVDQVEKKGGSPWLSRDAFEKSKDGSEMTQLRLFLKETIPVQARYTARRSEQALGKITKGLSPQRTRRVRDQFYRVAGHPHGIYALVDYVNFKGEGIRESERYAGKGWGLLQVLEEMKGEEEGLAALDAFADAAIFVLNRRIQNSDPKRGEKRWKLGWENRCNSYRVSK